MRFTPLSMIYTNRFKPIRCRLHFALLQRVSRPVFAYRFESEQCYAVAGKTNEWGESCKFKNPPGISPIEATRLLCYDRQPVARPALPGAVRRRCGRVVDCTGLENRQGETLREFESHRLRQTCKLSRWP